MKVAVCKHARTRKIDPIRPDIKWDAPYGVEQAVGLSIGFSNISGPLTSKALGDKTVRDGVVCLSANMADGSISQITMDRAAARMVAEKILAQLEAHPTVVVDPEPETIIW